MRLPLTHQVRKIVRYAVWSQPVLRILQFISAAPASASPASAAPASAAPASAAPALSLIIKYHK